MIIIVLKLTQIFTKHKNIENSEIENDLYLCYIIIYPLIMWHTEKKRKNIVIIKFWKCLKKKKFRI